jgi:hypothetical protein
MDNILEFKSKGTILSSLDDTETLGLEPNDWLVHDGDDIDECISNNAITSIWVGVNTLNLHGYADVPHLLRLIAGEVEYQQAVPPVKPELSEGDMDDE